MERGSDKHTARIDDELDRESRNLENAQTFGGRREEHLMREEPEPESPADPVLKNQMRGGEGPGLSLDAREARSEIARSLDRVVFPAERTALIRDARDNNAPGRVIRALEALPDGEFENVEAIWEALGGPREERF